MPLKTKINVGENSRSDSELRNIIKASVPPVNLDDPYTKITANKNWKETFAFINSPVERAGNKAVF